MSNNKFKKIFAFDFDNTIADTFEGAKLAFIELFKKQDLEIDQAVLAQLVKKGKPFDTIISTVAPNHKDGDLKQHFLNAYAEYGVDKTKAFPGIYELFRDIKSAGYLIIVVSAKSTENLKKCISFLELNPDEIIGNSGIEGKVEILRSKSALVYVGDQQSDVIAGKESGALTVLVNNNDFSHWEFAPDYNMHTISNLHKNLHLILSFLETKNSVLPSG